MADSSKIKSLEELSLAPLRTLPSGNYLRLMIFFGVMFAAALGVWGYQFIEGLVVTGLNYPFFWGVHIINVIFFLGLSIAGTFVSAILRLTGANWRSPLTRIGEMITVFILPLGAFCIFLDLGRFERGSYFVLFYANLTSPIIWDVISLNSYLILSVLYLYLPMIPDLALCRDRLTEVSYIRRKLYSLLSLGWTGTTEQKKLLDRLIGIMAIVIIPVGASVHTVLSYVFAVTVNPMWHSTIMGPYFVMGAVFSGIALLIICCAAFRKAFGLHEFITTLHFERLGLMLLAMSCVWLYFLICEHVPTYYADHAHEMNVLYDRIIGDYKYLFWLMVLSCFIIPVFTIGLKYTRTVKGITIAALFVILGMWLERFIIIVPTKANPLLHWQNLPPYYPSWVEWFIMTGWICGFCLFLMAFARVFPLLTVWEVKEELEHH